MSQSIETLCKALGISETQLKGIRRNYRMEHGRDAERELEKWLKHTWEEKRDRDSFLRAGALPSDLGSRATNPRAPALGRGRTGTQRPPGEGRRRHLKKVIKPPTAAQIEQAAEQSAYVEFRDSLDAGTVPRDVQNVYALQARQRFAEQRQIEAREELAEQRARQAAAIVRDTAVMLARSGGNPVEFLAGIQQVCALTQQEAQDGKSRAA